MPVDVSIVIPLYNEAEQIAKTLEQVVAVMRGTGRSFEVIVVDDGSRDHSPERVTAYLNGGTASEVRLVQHPYNKGNGAAVRTGIRNAQGEIVVCMDADGQHDPVQIPEMLALFPEYDLVVGARDQRYKGALHRNTANWIYNKFSSWLTDFEVKDLTSGFRAFRRDAIQPYLALFPQRFSYPTTSTMIMLRAGYNVRYVPIHAHPRQSGQSKIRLWRDGMNFLVIMMKIIMLYDPLKVFIPICVLMTVFGVASAAWGIASESRLYVPNSAVLFFASALIISLIGLVSSQIANLTALYHRDHD